MPLKSLNIAFKWYYIMCVYERLINKGFKKKINGFILKINLTGFYYLHI